MIRSLFQSLRWSWMVAALILAQPLSAQEPPAEQPAPPAAEQPTEPAPVDDAPPADQPPADQPPADQPPAEQPKPSDTPAEPGASQPPAEQPAAAEGGPAATAFNAKLDEWKALLKKMRALQASYQQAEEAELPALRKQWEDYVAQGRSMLPELRKLAMDAYLASPGTDRQLARFLEKMAVDALAADRFEAAYQTATQLLEAGSDTKSLLQVAGASAFVLNKYEEAEKYLTQAQEAGLLDPEWAVYLPLVDEYTAYWEEEQKIRQQEAEADDLPRVELNTTAGRIVVELFENEAPQTVNNFVSLVEKGFYDGTPFHRVLEHFMAQGGDPEGTGGGGPGYNIYGEADKENARMHFRGVLSMAHTGHPDTGGSQFFLTFVPTAHLNNKHTVFGRVIEGMEVLAEIQRDPGQAGRTPTKIETAKVLRKRDHEYVPTKVEKAADATAPPTDGSETTPPTDGSETTPPTDGSEPTPPAAEENADP